MKTLNEVIQEFERQEAFVAYYMQDGTQFRSDALHYLKEYKEKQNIRIYIPDGYIHSKIGDKNFSCPKCHAEFIVLPEENPALIWDDLRKMEGKPIWVEQYNGDTKGWLLILRTNYEVITCTTKHGNSFYLYKSSYGETWQAYRKERE